jgi:pSer/pThr/pTyr-binding forkhead associated (FHA) protein
MEHEMEIFFDGTVATYWVESWLPLVGLAIAFLAAWLTMWRLPISTIGVVLRVVSLMGFFAAMPLGMEKMGLRVGIVDYELVTFLSIVGSGVSTVLALVSLLVRSSSAPFASRTAMRGGTDRTQVGSVNDRTQFLGSSTGGFTSNEGPVLTVVTGQHPGRNYQLDGRVITIGRDSDNDIVLNDPSVSRHHAKVAYQNGQTVIEDLGSSNGIHVDGVRVQRQVLASDSSIKVGREELALAHVGSPVGAAQAAYANPSGNRASGGGSMDSNGMDRTIVRGTNASAVAWLAVKSGPMRGESIELKPGSYALGRDESSDIVIKDQSISRHHAAFQYKNNAFTLSDVGSLAGTFINRKRIGGLVLQAGSWMRVGETTMVLTTFEANEAPAVNSENTVMGGMSGVGATLQVQSGPGAGKVYELRQGNNVIGRGPECDVALEDGTISREHCVARLEGGKVTVYDAGSAAGTAVSGTMAYGTKLRSGDLITLGNIEMEFVSVRL